MFPLELVLLLVSIYLFNSRPTFTPILFRAPLRSWGRRRLQRKIEASEMEIGNTVGAMSWQIGFLCVILCGKIVISNSVGALCWVTLLVLGAFVLWDGDLGWLKTFFTTIQLDK